MARHTQRILGVEYPWGCDNFYGEPGPARIFNVDTGSSENITAGLDGTIWLLPASQVIPTNISPEADAGPDQVVAASEAGKALVTLDGSASSDSDGTIEAYRWYENDTLIAEGVTPQVEFATGEHTIVLMVVDDDGAIDWDEVVITVEPTAA